VIFSPAVVLCAQDAAVVTPVSPQADREPYLSVTDRQEIRDEAEYARVFGRPSEGVDWTAFRILVIQLTTTCKLQEPESAVSLSGIYADADGIYVVMESTQYGPIQGLAQLARIVYYSGPDNRPQTDVP
jgi:hypothetical protein